ncbi:MAG: FAD/NAD(P)-binding protein [Sedimentisphaerales bacterium]|jgi:sulfhydrogenase subunit gamma (sulfur reductase)
MWDLTPTEKLFRLERCDGLPFDYRAGQFMQVSVFGVGEAPISVSSSPTRGDYLDLTVRKAGVLTGKMHTLKSGATIGLRGPFGTCFDINSFKGKDLLLISGGCGLAPMRALIQNVEDRRAEFGKIRILYGAKSPLDVLYKEELAAWRRSKSLTCRVTVDSVPTGTCWDGHVGLIPSLVNQSAINPRRTEAIIIGPPIMYRFVIKELRDKGLADKNITISLERHMKCGNGKCGHCVIGHLYCCLDGPVFRLDHLAGLDTWT